MKPSDVALGETIPRDSKAEFYALICLGLNSKAKDRRDPVAITDDRFQAILARIMGHGMREEDMTTAVGFLEKKVVKRKI